MLHLIAVLVAFAKAGSAAALLLLLLLLLGTHEVLQSPGDALVHEVVGHPVATRRGPHHHRLRDDSKVHLLHTATVRHYGYKLWLIELCND